MTMTIREVNRVPDRYAPSNECRCLINEFNSMSAKAVELCLDSTYGFNSTVNKLRSITYSTPEYRHIKIAVRGSAIYLVKEEL